MLKKSIISILMISFILTIVFSHKVKSATLNSERYKITTKTYLSKNNHEDIKVNYPQISNLSDQEKQHKINKLIKEAIFKIIKDNSDSNSNDFLTLEIKYAIKLKSPRILSIQYLGYQHYQTAAYPNNLFYSTNIDVEKGIKLKLSEVVNINHDFLKIFKSKGKPRYMAGEAFDQDTILVAKDYIKTDLSDAELIKNFQEDDCPFYFTKSALGIVIFVTHAMGDNWEFEIEYKDLTSNLKAQNAVGKNFLNK